ncbi:hypothetical protein VD0002_g496 [Verticillium dahliae]|uniref:Deacetylase complex subunit n=2 Tax=Verticillium dahliae TaxID=27337 RepID=G2X9Z6_VERDV|nr:uncharacterized protein VDAG_06899 [Verticillium dahliae VdLs.17]KAF3343656.1 Protein SDS23 [Verticillium dahliae VDG2]KAH6702384.1 Sds3-like-domain-containing protein [Verticillium dahliae]EGY15735.1 hypothetical protein VDAG_06899 [Verticillium dahliae VdLs.17]PNH36393.1 hypothetical protein BJF96_g291 [Verticillium dahliae]PNH56797.1 hypothetical protein VD0003_g1007 [Verticillium dahliae]
MAANESTAAAGPSKRERKRLFITEKLAFLNEKFHRERDLTYRDQLQKIQVDNTLVQRLDPYASDALEVIASARRDHAEAQTPETLPENTRTLLHMSGPRFQDFLQEVEDLIEYRDSSVAQQKHEHDRRLHQYQNEHLYKIEAANREHRALADTLRDRLINTVSSRKYRLQKEKEALEISDSSALLLHPNQFSITNPASPGGTHKRATRLRKDAEDIPGYSEGKKRKRVPGEDDGSPAPARRALDPNTTTPLWQNEKLRYAAKHHGPAYSLDKLFTEKELSLTRLNASLAAHKYIQKHKVYSNGATSPNGSDSGHGDNDSAEQDGDSASAPMMERTASHTTRSTRAGINQSLLDAADASNTLELPKHIDILEPHEPTKIPSTHIASYFKTNGRVTENCPTSLTVEEANSDILLMELYKKYDAKHKPGASIDHPNGSKKLLESVVAPYVRTHYTGFRTGGRANPKAMNENLVSVEARDSAPSSLAAALGAAAPMSRQSSAAGGNTMSRQGSARGKTRKN